MKFLKKQGVAWVITIVMILIAIAIGSNGGDRNHIIDAPIGEVSTTYPTQEQFCYVFDDAGVLSSDEETKLNDLNRELYDSQGVVVACVTTNYGRSDLYDFALDYADDMGLGAYDFIVVLDISGDNYWLVQGFGLMDSFSDDDCGEYAWNYMEDHFARGEYGDALISLVEALSDWYQANNW